MTPTDSKRSLPECQTHLRRRLSNPHHEAGGTEECYSFEDEWSEIRPIQGSGDIEMAAKVAAACGSPSMSRRRSTIATDQNAEPSKAGLFE